MSEEQVKEAFIEAEDSYMSSHFFLDEIKIRIDKPTADGMRSNYERIGLGIFHPRLKTKVNDQTKRIKGFAFPKREVELALNGTSSIPQLECDEKRTDHSGIFLALGKHSEEDGGGINLILYGLNQNGELIENTSPSRIFDFSQICPDNCPDTGIQFPDGPECLE